MHAGIGPAARLHSDPGTPVPDPTLEGADLPHLAGVEELVVTWSGELEVDRSGEWLQAHERPPLGATASHRHHRWQRRWPSI